MRKLLLLSMMGIGAAATAAAQGVQNMDFYYLFGGAHVPNRRIPGSNVALQDTTGIYFAIGYGYQLVRFSAASLWLDVPTALGMPGTSAASGGGSVLNSYYVLIPGVRLMLPVQSRVSVYGLAGFGYGRFYYPSLDSPSSIPTSNSTAHGVFGLGAGIDIRLSRHFSIRIETRDFVAGRGLSGSDGRHHFAPAAGIALHH